MIGLFFPSNTTAPPAASPPHLTPIHTTPGVHHIPPFDLKFAYVTCSDHVMEDGESFEL